MTEEPQPLTADELKRFYKYLRENIKEFCESDTPFKKKARFWQREQGKGLIIPDIKEVLLNEPIAKKGKNFYKDSGKDVFCIFDAVKERFHNFSEQLYQDMLSSKHIPFNMFIPLDKDKEYFKKIFNEIIGNKIKSIDLLKIEYAPGPDPQTNYLNDDTSFDAYIVYTSIDDEIDNRKGIIGIEVKYTETSYSLKKESKERYNVYKENSTYYKITNASPAFIGKHYTPNDELRKNEYRQIWRNHILGESTLQKNNEKFKDFISITIYPKGNKHFTKVGENYKKKFLDKDYKYRCLFFTYEDLFVLFDKHCKEMEQPKKGQYEHWIKWMRERYIVKDDEIRKFCDKHCR